MSGIKSRPTYAPLALDPTGHSHLVVSDQPALPRDIAGAEIWLTGSPATAAPATGAMRKFRAAADLLASLRHRLARAPVGLRLYAVGTEPFLWDVRNIAADAGLGEGEIFLTHAGSQCRRVYCTHCKTLNQAVTTSITACVGCGASLFVRDHFSRRLAAYMGVAVDAETPGDIPAPETLYP